MSHIRVLIVEDEVLIAEDIRACLNNFDYKVSGVAYDQAAALNELRDNPPDIVLLDINLEGGLEGIEIAKIINKTYKLPFIYLTSYANRSVLEQAKPTRPMGYVVKPFDEKDLFTALEIAYFNYGQLMKPARWDLDKFNQQLYSHLTTKEFEILRDLFEGKTNKQLCEKHFVSINTVKTHVKNIYEKMDVHTRSEVIAKSRSLLGISFQ